MIFLPVTMSGVALIDRPSRTILSRRYGVTVETAEDMIRQNGDSAVVALVEIVKDELGQLT